MIDKALTHAKKIDTMIDPLRDFANKFASPVLDLAIRIHIAEIFFKSGMLKFKNYLNGNWDNTVYLFQDIHPIPGVPADIAAVAATGGELLLPVLLVFGLFGRFAAAGLLVMTLMIEFIIPAEYELSNPQHYFWMLLLAVTLVKGPGLLSADHFLLNFIRGSKAKKKKTSKKK